MKGRGMQTNVSHGSGLKSRFQRVGRWREERKAPSQACRQRPGSSFLQHFQILTKKPHSFSPSSPVRTLLVRLLCSSSAPKVWTYEPLHLLSSPLPSHFLYLFTIKCQSLLVRTYLSPSTFCLSSNYHLAATLLLPPLWRSVTPCSGEWAGVEASSTTRSAASFQHASCSSLSLSVSQPPLSLFRNPPLSFNFCLLPSSCHFSFLPSHYPSLPRSVTVNCLDGAPVHSHTLLHRWLTSLIKCYLWEPPAYHGPPRNH